MGDIGFEVQTGRCFVRAAILLLSGDEEGYGIEIGQVIAG
jgi:hypothetical protein